MGLRSKNSGRSRYGLNLYSVDIIVKVHQPDDADKHLNKLDHTQTTQLYTEYLTDLLNEINIL